MAVPVITSELLAELQSILEECRSEWIPNRKAAHYRQLEQAIASLEKLQNLTQSDPNSNQTRWEWYHQGELWRDLNLGAGLIQARPKAKFESKQYFIQRQVRVTAILDWLFPPPV